jgi:hypothetical protein
LAEAIESPLKAVDADCGTGCEEQPSCRIAVSLE